MADVIVIGSGFGGATVASRLCEAGLSVALIERGPWRDTLPVRSMGIGERSPLPRGRAGLKTLLRTMRSALLPRGSLTINRKGLFEIHIGRGLNVICSSGVGGGSHVYSGLNVRPPEPGYWDGICDELSDGDMEPRYQRVIDTMGARTPMADDRLPHTLEERFGNSEVIDARDADQELTMGFAFPETPGTPKTVRTADGVERREAEPGLDGNLGSEGGGKTTLDFALLAGALKRGLEVHDLCEVTEIARCDTKSGYRVFFRNHRAGKDEILEAESVVLAAGTMNTLRLLLHSAASGALAEMPGLGECFGGNGDYFGYWNLGETDRDLSKSMPVHGPVRVKETAALGPGQPWPMLVEGALPGAELLPLGRWTAKKRREGSFIAGIGPDEQKGVVTYRKGRMKIDYDPNRSEIYARIRAAFRYLGEKTGRRVYHFQRPMTVHPTGGACIGSSAEDGVVDHRGEAFANPGLFVADAAALPKPVGGPPSMTIAAWADRVAEGIITRTNAR